ncbi:type VI secretion system-associated protein (plasmid) [Burkholderia sp. SFA1]|uniref:type VI secretion system baseplate subunit TssK n=1 Tax=unclassified Caballeronia TaxID=2646786 RepID=UPI001F438EB1|nr:MULTISPECIES: type VI secretion system baseplate subunit TssK [unclassified Caballeronia]MCE4545741.1 type VI secretion system baseplate subunit TssK [Caballeronia sp. PC1]MCE4572137.1 type VI secretion system baseplate subunit TssK [Caballeronia sp. CLC5]BBQ01091.1 type VI secretion system-associated protein [Burkholderia sp. SFA1]
MTWNQRMIWSEGLFLEPQHFQQQDRFFEHLVRSHARATQAWSWGWASVMLDDIALGLGKVALASAFGVLPDGTAFSFPDDAPAPPPLDIPAGARDETVLLALPLARAGAMESDPDNATPDAAPEDGRPGALRYRTTDTSVADVTTSGERVAQLRVGAPNLRLMLARDATDAFATIGIARVLERRADNRVMLDTAYIPPMLHALADARLAGYAQEIAGLLHQHADRLARHIANPGRGGVAEIADFLLLQTLNRFEPQFAHLLQVPLLHPERLYQTTLALAGDLAAFDERRRVLAYPPYRHDDLASSFEPLMRDVRQLLAQVPEPNAIAIELQTRKPGLRVAVINDLDLVRTAGFVLAASAQMPGEALRTRFPTQVKVAPAEKLRDLVNLALPGIGLRAMPVAPRQIPFHAGCSYFELDRGGELWKELEQTGNLAMYIAGEFPALELEFWAIRH